MKFVLVSTFHKKITGHETIVYDLIYGTRPGWTVKKKIQAIKVSLSVYTLTTTAIVMHFGVQKNIYIYNIYACCIFIYMHYLYITVCLNSIVRKVMNHQRLPCTQINVQLSIVCRPQTTLAQRSHENLWDLMVEPFLSFIFIFVIKFCDGWLINLSCGKIIMLFVCILPLSTLTCYLFTNSFLVDQNLMITSLSRSF